MNKTDKLQINNLLNEIAFIAHVASKTDVDRRELLILLKQIKDLALEGIK